MKTDTGLELVERESKGAGAVNEPIVIAGERDGLALLSEKVHRRQVSPSKVLTGLGKGSNARATTGGASSIKAKRPNSERTSSACDRVSFRA